MVKDPRFTADADSYETWLGSDDAVENLWHTTERDIFVFTEDGVYLPCEIGPIDSETRISPDKFNDYDVTVEYKNRPTRLAIVALLTAALFIVGVLTAGGLGVVFLAASVLSLLVLGVMTVKERNRVNAFTHITLYMGRHKARVTTEGDHVSSIEPQLNSLIDCPPNDTEPSADSAD